MGLHTSCVCVVSGILRSHFGPSHSGSSRLRRRGDPMLLRRICHPHTRPLARAEMLAKHLKRSDAVDKTQPAIRDALQNLSQKVDKTDANVTEFEAEVQRMHALARDRQEKSRLPFRCTHTLECPVGGLRGIGCWARRAGSSGKRIVPYEDTSRGRTAACKPSASSGEPGDPLLMRPSPQAAGAVWAEGRATTTAGQPSCAGCPAVVMRKASSL